MGDALVDALGLIVDKTREDTGASLRLRVGRVQKVSIDLTVVDIVVGPDYVADNEATYDSVVYPNMPTLAKVGVGDIVFWLQTGAGGGIVLGARGSAFPASSTPPPAGGGSTSAWTSYTPTLSNATVGNGTLVSSYVVLEDLVVVYKGSFTLGSTSTITGQIGITFPVAADNSVAQSVGVAACIDTGVAARYPTVLNASGSFYVGTGVVNGTVPFTWASGDILRWTITYEIV